MTCKTFFITGAEGVGKSSVVSSLQQAFPDLDIHDFDEVGVPDNPPLSWRLETTKHWLDVAIANKEKNISTCIVGLTFPEEIKSFKESKSLDLVFYLLDVSTQERATRLTKRKAAPEVIAETEILFLLREQQISIVIDTTSLSIKETSNILIELINKSLS